MKSMPPAALLLASLLVWGGAVSAGAQQHRATNLGNPATRFADPITSPDELRARFADMRLWPDIASILRQWGWQGDMDDLLQAAATAEIREAPIAPGTRLPFMSSRKNGLPVTLKDVEWAGREPAPAYAFDFASQGRRYRCITPKACSNFFLEDLGAPRLTLECIAPEQVPVGRPVRVCMVVRNLGDGAEPSPVVTLPFPPGTRLTRMTQGGVVTAGDVSWTLPELAPRGEMQLCATFTTTQPGDLELRWIARGDHSGETTFTCATRVFGIHALLLELIDEDDPVPVGETVTYVIRVTNQGSAPSTGVRFTATLPDEQEFLDGDGPTALRREGRAVNALPLASLEPGASAAWSVRTRALTAGDVRFQLSLMSDQLTRPVEETEATQQY